MAWRQLCIGLVLLVQFQVYDTLGCSEEDHIALSQLKASFNYSSELTNIPAWDAKDCCAWEGVECSNKTGRVIHLSLRRLWDTDYLNTSLFLPFTELTSLDLSQNLLLGSVWDGGFERLSRLSQLEILDLDFNRFNNSILPSLSKISTLKNLSLQSNGLEGSTHIQELAALTNLEMLNLGSNAIRSFISAQGLRRMRKLQYLELGANHNLDSSVMQDLSAALSLKHLGLSSCYSGQQQAVKGFERLSRLSQLEMLDLDSNRFNNSILPSLSTISTLKNLSLSHNRLKGSTHIQELAALTNLEMLDLSFNAISSFITAQGLRKMTKLKYLDLSYNGLDRLDGANAKGTSNSQLDLQNMGSLISLQFLDLSTNELNGTFTSLGLCKLRKLQELVISRNKLNGILPSCLTNLTSLRVLDLSYNQFVGNIALSPITNLTSLEVLSLSPNNFQSLIPLSAFANLSKLKAFFLDCAYKGMVVETEYLTWIPSFQLKVLHVSNCAVNNLTRAIHNFLYNQYDLRSIDLSSNNLEGNFLTWLLENNSKLEVIKLRNNSFTGTFDLPHHLNMKILDVSQNHLHGQIPKNIGMIFPNLTDLNISRNAFEGNLPSSFGDRSSLRMLDMSNNNFSGIVPNFSGIVPKPLVMGFPSLYFLKLSNNNLHGEISLKFSNLTNLEFLYLDGNKFTGKIPNSLSYCSNLKVLDISNNLLSGSLPQWMGNMSFLAGIDMEKNFLGGPIPHEFCKLAELWFLNLAENDLSGSIPSCFSPKMIQYVNFQGNMLTGAMTHAFSKSLELVTLNVRDNFLTGSIPNWIGKLPRLSILLLKGNRFEGSIPTDLCNLSNFSIMDLSNNSLSGPIPSCLNNITFIARDKNVRYGFFDSSSLISYLEGYSSIYVEESTMYPTIDMPIQVEFTTKKRSDTYKGEILNFMSGIDLSCNQLTGHIPLEIGNLSQIRALNLSHNHLIGPIPVTFSNLLQLESLDLSYNNLTGKIPSQLTKLNFLAVFSVAYNNLSGRTPDLIGQFGTFGESSYDGNPLLCGPLLQNNCSTNSTVTGETKMKETEGPVDMAAFYASFTAAYITILLGIILVLYINPYWCQWWFHHIEVCITSCY